MKIHRTTPYALLLGVACMLSGVWLFAEDEPDEANREHPSLSELPAACQSLLKNLSLTGQPVELEKERHGDSLLYEVEFLDNGRETEVEMTEDGYLIVIEKTVEPEQIPAAVHRAIDWQSAEGRAVRVTAVTRVVYEVEIEGRRNKAIFDATGKNLRSRKSSESNDD